MRSLVLGRRFVLHHGHIYGRCNGLLETGDDLRWVLDPYPAKLDAFKQKCSGVKNAFYGLLTARGCQGAGQGDGRKYLAYYSERLHVECAVYAGELVQGGIIDEVIQVLGLGPHRLNDPSGF